MNRAQPSIRIVKPVWDRDGMLYAPQLGSPDVFKPNNRRSEHTLRRVNMALASYVQQPDDAAWTALKHVCLTHNYLRSRQRYCIDVDNSWHVQSENGTKLCVSMSLLTVHDEYNPISVRMLHNAGGKMTAESTKAEEVDYLMRNLAWVKGLWNGVTHVDDLMAISIAETYVLGMLKEASVRKSAA